MMRPTVRMRATTDNNAMARWLRKDRLTDKAQRALANMSVKVDRCATALQPPRNSGCAEVPEDAAASTPFDHQSSPFSEESDWAWGQYLDEPPRNQQIGIFGTAAAIEIIALATEKLSDHSRSSLGTLPFSPAEYDSPSARKARTEAIDKNDLKTTFKVAALVHAWNALPQGTLSGKELAAQSLLDLRTADGGWSDSKDDGHLQTAQPYATAVALFALRSAGKLTVPIASSAVAALHVSSDDKFGISLWALLSLALDGLDSNLDSTCGDVLHDARIQVRQWVRTARPSKTAFAIDGYDFQTAERESGGNGRRYAFMFYMPHCMVGLSILKSSELMRRAQERAYAQRVVGAYADEVKSRGLVRPEGRNRDSTVEALWVARLFKAYISRPRPQTDISLLNQRVMEPLLSLRIWRHGLQVIFIALGTFVAVFSGVALANTLTGQPAIAGVGLIFSIASSALSSIVAAIIIDGQKA